MKRIMFSSVVSLLLCGNGYGQMTGQEFDRMADSLNYITAFFLLDETIDRGVALGEISVFSQFFPKLYERQYGRSITVKEYWSDSTDNYRNTKIAWNIYLEGRKLRGGIWEKNLPNYLRKLEILTDFCANELSGTPKESDKDSLLNILEQVVLNSKFLNEREGELGVGTAEEDERTNPEQNEDIAQDSINISTELQSLQDAIAEMSGDLQYMESRLDEAESRIGGTASQTTLAIIAIVSSGLAIILGVISLIATREPRLKGILQELRSKTGSTTTDTDQKLETIEQSVSRSISELKRELNSLSGRLEKMESREVFPVAPTPVYEPPRPEPIRPMEPQYETFYITAPDPEGYFFDDKKRTSPADGIDPTVYKMKVKGNEAVFEPLTEARPSSMLLQEPAEFLDPVCSVLGERGSHGIKVEKSGSLKKEGEYWRVVTKCQIRLT